MTDDNVVEITDHVILTGISADIGSVKQELVEASNMIAELIEAHTRRVYELHRTIARLAWLVGVDIVLTLVAIAVLIRYLPPP
jgi:hypothetical protein